MVGLVLELELESAPVPGSGVEGSMVLGFVRGLAPELMSGNTTTPEFGEDRKLHIVVVGLVLEPELESAPDTGLKESRKLCIVVVGLVPLDLVLVLCFESAVSPGSGEECGLRIVVVGLVPLAPGSEGEHNMVFGFVPECVSERAAVGSTVLGFVPETGLEDATILGSKEVHSTMPGFGLAFGFGPELDPEMEQGSEMVAAQEEVVGKIVQCKYSFGCQPWTVERQRQAAGGWRQLG